ncbi:50S ribosomal protein L29 [Thermodesulfovibrio sp. 1176]|uniref:50S ribosomal protein L29 n=1 Tax=Thermodesulfovibrio sp. 1176 TaxID=3043424 RepID=UPI002482B13B|nr:50S ribosomal protein L29 [Thermodesulfovibrio sp. 1176]MDI1471447.1 50S ribosomal protein L29 [Thermodesulfovibrio sp. 1176]
MKAKELRNFSIDELKKKERDLRREFFNLRFQLAKGELQNVKRINAVKKDIARILTIITEKTKKFQVKS